MDAYLRDEDQFQRGDTLDSFGLVLDVRCLKLGDLDINVWYLNDYGDLNVSYVETYYMVDLFMILDLDNFSFLVGRLLFNFGHDTLRRTYVPDGILDTIASFGLQVAKDLMDLCNVRVDILDFS